MTMCCRISAAPRTRSAAPTITTAKAGRSTSPTCAPATNCTTPLPPAARRPGFRANADFNGAEQEGVGNYQLTVRKMRRCSAAVAYLRPAMKRPNLTVEIRAFARRVLFDGKRAIGLEYAQDGAVRRVGARREVLLAGGSLLSPQLLQLSGVGPGELLRRYGIEMVHELPGVGDHLQDHLGCRLIYKAKKPNTLNEISRSWVRQVQTGLEYLFGRRGALMMGAAPIGLFARTREGLASPDVQYQFLAGSFDKPGEKMHPFPGCSLVAIPCRPESRGWLRITSPDPAVPPAMQPNYLATQADQETMIAGIEDLAPHLPDPDDAAIRRRGILARRAGGQRRGPARPRQEDRQHDLPPDFDLHDGAAGDRGGRQRVAGARDRGAARRRRLGDAGRDLRQHQRRNDHDRREGLRPDPRRAAPRSPVAGGLIPAPARAGPGDCPRVAGLDFRRCSADLNRQGRQSEDLLPMGAVWAWVPHWVIGVGIMAAPAILVLLIYRWLAEWLGRLAARRQPFLHQLLRRGRQPVGAILVILALGLALPAARFPYDWAVAGGHVLLVALVLALGWIASKALDIGAELYLRRFRTDSDDNLTARKHVTQINILRRAAQTLLVIITLSTALMTVAAVRQYGVSLFASAGAAGIVVGLAARPVLSNLLAGIQIAVTQPIRVEDSVVVEGEWGWIETITSTYVVIRLWDLRRLIVPLSYFIEKPFQNWTYQTANLVGTVILHVDYTAPLDRIREKLQEIVHGSDLWDGNVVNLQVTDSTENTLELRALVSARNAGDTFNLRCLVREKLIAFLQSERQRTEPANPSDPDDREQLRQAAGPRASGA